MRIQRKPKARFGPSRMVDTSYNYLTLLRCVFIRVIVEAKVEALIFRLRLGDPVSNDFSFLQSKMYTTRLRHSTKPPSCAYCAALEEIDDCSHHKSYITLALRCRHL